MKTSIRQFLKDEEGVTAIEYGLIAGLVAVAIIAALLSLSGGLNTLFESIGDKLGDIAEQVEGEEDS
jgi:Flp pilus assembly protein, pilin Flp